MSSKDTHRRFHLLRNESKPQQKETGTFITLAVTQKDQLQEETNVSLPSDENVREARNWVNHNKK